MRYIVAEKPFIYIELEGKRAFLFHDVLTGLYELHEGDLVRLFGKANKRGQFIIRHYEKIRSNREDPFKSYKGHPYPKKGHHSFK